MGMPTAVMRALQVGSAGVAFRTCDLRRRGSDSDLKVRLRPRAVVVNRPDFAYWKCALMINFGSGHL